MAEIIERFLNTNKFHNPVSIANLSLLAYIFFVPFNNLAEEVGNIKTEQTKNKTSVELKLDFIDEKFDGVKEDIEKIEQRMINIDGTLINLDTRFQAIEKKIG